MVIKLSKLQTLIFNFFLFRNKSLIFILGALLFSKCLLVSIKAQVVSYQWVPEYYAVIDGEEQLVFTWEFPNSKVTTGRVVGNNLPDMIVGSESGSLGLYENIGTVDQPKFRLKELRLSGYGKADYKSVFRVLPQSNLNEVSVNSPEQMRPLDFGSRAAPALFNYIEPNQLDLLVGNADGQLILLTNTGTSEKPRFFYDPEQSSIFSELTLRELNLKNVVPNFCNINQDSAIDLMLGVADGRVLVFLGRINYNKKLYYEPNPDFTLKLDYGKNASASCVDWEDNNMPSIIVGQQDGYISYFKNIGDPFYPKFDKPTFFFYKIDAGGEASPYFTKLTPDSTDLLLGSNGSKIKHYQFRDFEGEKNLWSINHNLTNFARLNSFGKDTNISSGNLFGAGKKDIILGNSKGSLSLYKNNSTADKIILSKITDNLLPDIVLTGAAPEIIDFIPNALPSLAVGTKSGKILYFNNAGTRSNPIFKITNNNLIDLGFESPIIRAVDLDGIGKFDLFVGGESGGLKFYRNTGTALDPSFKEDDTEDIIKIEDLAPSNFYAPSFFNWNKFLVPNLVVGGDSGNLEILNFNPKNVNLLPDLPVDFQEYLASSFEFPDWRFQKEMPNARPYFFDILNNNQPAMLVSNRSGDMLLFLQVDSQLHDTQEIFAQYQERKRRARLKKIREKILNTKFSNIDPVFARTSQKLTATNFSEPAPYFAKLSGDKLNDLVIGYRSGRIDVYLNSGDERFWKFDLVQTLYLPDKDGSATPVLIDLDNNETLDMLVGSASGQLYYYKNITAKPSFSFEIQNNYFKDLKFGKNVVPSVVYIKNRSLPDIVLGDREGRLTYLKNLSYYSKTNFIPKFEVESRPEFNLDFELSLAPRFADLNNDGVPEMVLGDEKGYVKVYRYSNDSRKYIWKYENKWSVNQALGYKTVPAFADISGFGIKDMIVGVADGRLILFKNQAITSEILKKLEQQELSKN